jgi:hypothetical protein
MSAETELDLLLRHRRAAKHYGDIAAQAEAETVYKYSLFRILNGRCVDIDHVGTLASIPDGWSWMKREREA